MERFTWGRGRPILTVDGIIPDLNWGSGEGGAQMSDGLPFPASRVEQAAPTTLRKCQHKHFLPQVALCEVKGTDIKKTKQKKPCLPDIKWLSLILRFCTNWTCISLSTQQQAIKATSAPLLQCCPRCLSQAATLF